MNLPNKIILVLFFACFCNYCLAQECQANVSIKINADSTKFFVDDILMGQGNNFVTKLDAGYGLTYY